MEAPGPERYYGGVARAAGRFEPGSGGVRMQPGEWITPGDLPRVGFGGHFYTNGAHFQGAHSDDRCGGFSYSKRR